MSKGKHLEILRLLPLQILDGLLFRMIFLINILWNPLADKRLNIYILLKNWMNFYVLTQMVFQFLPCSMQEGIINFQHPCPFGSLVSPLLHSHISNGTGQGHCPLSSSHGLSLGHSSKASIPITPLKLHGGPHGPHVDNSNRWLILWVNLTGIKNTQIAGETLFLGVSCVSGRGAHLLQYTE